MALDEPWWFNIVNYVRDSDVESFLSQHAQRESVEGPARDDEPEHSQRVPENALVFSSRRPQVCQSAPTKIVGQPNLIIINGKLLHGCNGDFGTSQLLELLPPILFLLDDISEHAAKPVMQKTLSSANKVRARVSKCEIILNVLRAHVQGLFGSLKVAVIVDEPHHFLGPCRPFNIPTISIVFQWEIFKILKSIKYSTIKRISYFNK